MNNLQTEKIKLWGIIQGVGFRPFVAKTAKKLGMKGQVLNLGGLVEITVTDTAARIDSFIETLKAEKPGPAEIVHIRRDVIAYMEFSDFCIVKSGIGDDEIAMIPSDLAICPECLKELYDPSNPRYQHPFISCMICGPRYTITDRFPYDRENTSMTDFPMCDFCDDEYTDIGSRRYHAQTISCHDCGPQLIWKDLRSSSGTAAGSVAPEELSGPADDIAILDTAADILAGDGVIAFKSVGGYNLVCSPFSAKAVSRLRQIKHRESKPFAVMFRSTEEIRKYCRVNEVEESLLYSSARPIILLEHMLDEADLPAEYDLTDLKNSRFIGSFLPSFAAQYLLLDRISPLIFTSANASDMPMIKDDTVMQDMAGIISDDETMPNIDGILYNRRDIRIRMDDSVVRVIDSQPQMIRRSKGYAPLPVYIDNDSDELGSRMILAAGSQLKNSFALSKGPFAYMSQYFGDMDTIENQDIYIENIDRMKKLFRIEPELVVCDMHPMYFTTEFAGAFASENKLPVMQVQHHHAHIASVMAENNIKGPVIGVSFDGTGYGTDGNIWGGEFMRCEGGEMQRLSHLKYIEMIGGDSSMKDAARSALCYINAYDNKRAPESDEIELHLDDIIEFGRERLNGRPESAFVAKALSAGINTIRSSSMGRLFDAVSALLGICDYNHHEGKCAIRLEDAAAFAMNHPGEDSPGLADSKACELALSFHERIIDMIVDECIRIRASEPELSQVALSGGTFQNKIIMEGVLKKLRAEGFAPYYNVSVSPNDGGIALGQIYIAMQSQKQSV